MKKHYKGIDYTKEDFEALKAGNEEALSNAYLSFYEYITGILLYKYDLNQVDVDDVYSDSVLKFRAAVVKGNVVFGNIKGYLLKIAINLIRERKRQAKMKMRNLEGFFMLQDDATEIDDEIDINISGDNSISKKKALAVIWALNQLGETCKGILTDTIINGIKPGQLYEKYAYKNARVLTDKKVKCKKQLLELTKKRLAEL